MSAGIRRGHSGAPDAATAVAELHAAIAQPDASLVIFFCSHTHDLDAIAAEVREHFAGRLVIGATSAGEIGPAGYRDGTIAGVSFPRDRFTVAARLFGDLQRFEPMAARTAVYDVVTDLARLAPAVTDDQLFAIDLIDGLSIREEPVVHALQSALGHVPVVGGSSAGDRTRRDTPVFFDGAFHHDAAVLALAATDVPFRLFTTHHFAPGERRAVVTRADPSRRLVQEIDGLPAASAYAEIAGIPRDRLTVERTALNPVVVRIGGLDFVRSVMAVHDDDSLTFHCAIEEGLVLRIATAGDLLGDLDRTFDRLSDEVGPIECTLAFDCIQRAVEVATTGIRDDVGDRMIANRTVGFTTFGEQFRGLHVNQTLTGIAFGQAAS